MLIRLLRNILVKMAYLRWTGRGIFPNIWAAVIRRITLIKLTYRTLTYNHFVDQGYIADILMEPMFWFVDNFTKRLGPFFVAAVCVLTSFVIGVAYTIGLPFWWDRSPAFTCILLLVGHWLLVNVIFHFYFACITSPGYPPQGKLITEAVSICKKCISPKPPRTHHCSVCDRCVLKMDHHCPWLNNCVGHYNHRYFFLFMVFMVIGSFFLMVFGIELAWDEIFGDGTEVREVVEEELIGHPVRFNHSKLIPMREMMKNGSFHPLPQQMTDVPPKPRNWSRTCLVFTAFLVAGCFFALGSLSVWHSRLISKGESSIESHINASEVKRLSAQGKVYENPYNFGIKKNWKLFLGMVNGRGWRHVIFPSIHPPDGNGLSWKTIPSLEDLEVTTEKEK